jgi:hypothetical protein
MAIIRSDAESILWISTLVVCFWTLQLPLLANLLSYYFPVMQDVLCKRLGKEEEEKGVKGDDLSGSHAIMDFEKLIDTSATTLKRNTWHIAFPVWYHHIYCHYLHYLR